MGWLSREPAKLQDVSEKKSLPSGVWEKCPSCSEIVLISDLEENHLVCPTCNYHHRFPGEQRIELLIDNNTFFEWDHTLCSNDPLLSDDGRPYKDRLKNMIKKTSKYDAVITGAGLLNNRPVALGVLDFFWMGGSMGSVVGERINRMFARARRNNMPVILVSSSGGARMQEGLLSLMQMAKTSTAIALHREASLPFISVMCDPTTGGVAASFAMLGDINYAEPKSTIGFAGRRVIENIIRQKLPENFQTAEFCFEHGVLDKIVKRQEMKEILSRTLNILCEPLPKNKQKN
ncbi:acetyl-CoA carboxylase, carboxyltransferase subunit beta [Pigmentibacter sp. JX0631]|uniref:acetyl-CoA carboxylase, carboxyltransferase subunit beta n=1 Tax=Pigmentibacter sp. JX0631 TaxID=2976982 RepID=UPI002468466A|nr:acetyl-CoA carboxylase, carboxyltransferase subunit beta [Pigmentibacter sp. JX0631]WGL58572.1 acetyl-CoA carboxylase, carboxyltransferase subunit beta [Pigmentibacter sp. JX0631]